MYLDITEYRPSTCIVLTTHTADRTWRERSSMFISPFNVSNYDFASLVLFKL